MQEAGATAVLVEEDGVLLGAIAVRDELRPEARGVINRLSNAGYALAMLTGDNRLTADALGAAVGITEIYAELRPEDKSDIIRTLKARQSTAMVGDGINDAEALAQADVSIAMGMGSDIALDVAKITLVNSDLAKIPQALRLSKLTVHGIRQNLFWAFVYNLIGIPVAAGLLYPAFGILIDPMYASAAMALSSLSVVGNSLRLKTQSLD